MVSPSAWVKREEQQREKQMSRIHASVPSHLEKQPRDACEHPSRKLSVNTPKTFLHPPRPP